MIDKIVFNTLQDLLIDDAHREDGIIKMDLEVCGNNYISLFYDDLNIRLDLDGTYKLINPDDSRTT
jgi:hypothetical protein